MTLSKTQLIFLIVWQVILWLAIGFNFYAWNKWQKVKKAFEKELNSIMAANAKINEARYLKITRTSRDNSNEKPLIPEA